MNNQRESNDNTSFNQSMQQLRNFMSMPTSNLQANDNNQRELERRNSSFKKKLDQDMQGFWKQRMSEICDNPKDIRGAHMLPYARIKKVMKSDEQVKMVSADTPVVFAKACEMFIMELAQRAWIHTEQNKRKTVQRNDVANAIRDEGLLAFLEDVVPMEKAYCQEDPVSLGNQYPAGGYAPPPMMNNMQSTNQSEVVAPAAATNNNPGFTYPMNFGYNNNNGFPQ